MGHNTTVEGTSGKCVQLYRAPFLYFGPQITTSALLTIQNKRSQAHLISLAL